jgi:hypothetical protein
MVYVLLHVLDAGGGSFDGAEYGMSGAGLGDRLIADVVLLEFEVERD